MDNSGSLFGSAIVGTGLAIAGGVLFYFALKNKTLNWDDIFNNIPPINIPPIGGGGSTGGGTGGGTTGGGTTGGGTGGTATGSTILGAAGDWGSGRNNNWEKTVQVMVNNKVNLALGLGDYSYTSDKDFQKVVDKLKAAGIAMNGAEGNHDSSAYAKLFGQDSMLTAVDSGPARIIILNTEGAASANAAFAEKELKATTKPWKIFIMHKPLYTNASDHGPETALANALKPIILKYGVQLVMAGHNHNYQRMVISGMPNTVFISSGTGGEGAYTLKASQAGTKYMNDKDFGATIISINGSTLSGKFVTHAGKVADSWTQNLAASSANLAIREAMFARISA